MKNLSVLLKVLGLSFGKLGPDLGLSVILAKQKLS